MRYKEQLKDTLKSLSMGYGIGFVISFILSMLMYKTVNMEMIGITFAFDLIFGSIISMFLVMKKGVAFSFFYKTLFGFAKNGMRVIVGNMVGSPVMMAIFIIPLVVMGALSMALMFFMMISFPLTIIYVFIMFIVEKFAGEINDNVANILDKLVPIVSAVLTVVLICSII